MTEFFRSAAGLVVRAASVPVGVDACGTSYTVPAGGSLTIPLTYPCHVVFPDTTRDFSCKVDIDGDGACGTDADTEAFMDAYWAGEEAADWNGDSAVNYADVVAFFHALGGE